MFEQRKPLPPGTVISWNGFEATVTHDTGNWFLDVEFKNDLGNPVQVSWAWKVGGDACQVISMPPERKPKPAGTSAPATACEHGKRSRELCEVCSVEAREHEAFEAFWANSGFEKFKDTGYACWLARAALTSTDKGKSND